MDNIIDGETLLNNVYKNIIKDVIVNITGDTSLMKDTHLLEDRNEWIKKYTENGSRGDNSTYETDIQTLAIMVEQIKRYGEIYYNKHEQNIYK